MKELISKEDIQKTDLVFFESESGFHFAIDSTYLEQVGEFKMKLPTGEVFDTEIHCKETKKYFLISAFWKKDKEEFEDYIISEDEEVIEELDDQIFFYGLSEEQIKHNILNPDKHEEEFQITKYKPYTF